MGTLLPGDVVVVRTADLFGEAIRIAEKIQHKPDMRNHVAILHHIDYANGVNWYLEGRPGGVGWHPFKVLEDQYQNSKWTVDNSAQPKTLAQRQAVCASMLRLFGAPYDWGAIEADAANALRLPDIWEMWGGTMPGHVVCSSAASWAYRAAQVAAPEIGGGRFTEPGDWDRFIERQAWLPSPR